MHDSGRVIVAHYLVSVKPAPVTPVPAATLVLLRNRSAGAVEIWLIRRHTARKIAAGDVVFPGGKNEVSDGADDAAAWCRSIDAARPHAARLAATPSAALGHWVGVIRETFEEVGILLAYAADGRPVRLDRERYAAYRRACQADHRAFWEMLRAERLTLATETLCTSPTGSRRRFSRCASTPGSSPDDARGQEAIADERGITEVRWLTPGEAIEANARGQLSLRNPTVKNLQLFDGAATTAAALERLNGREVRTILPRVIIEGDKRRVILPGEPGYF